MKFQCVSCKRTFVYPAKKTENQFSEKTSGSHSNSFYFRTVSIYEPVILSTFEKHVCPYCGSLDLTEYVEPQLQVEAVYVHDLTTADQKLLSTLLAEGWVIVSRYAKQYVLEKLKEEKKE